MVRARSSFRSPAPVAATVLVLLAAALGSIAPAAAAERCPSGRDEYAAYQEDVAFVPLAPGGLASTFCYPARLFRPASDEPDGLRFVSDDGLAWFRAFQEPAGPGPSGGRARPGDLMAEAESRLADEGASVTYRASKADWFVLSGYRGDRIYYRRSVLTRDGTTADTLLIEFPQEQKPFYRDIVARMSWSFKAR